MSLLDSEGNPLLFRTEERFCMVMCDNCGESFYNRKQFDHVTANFVSFACKFCRAEAAVVDDYMELPVKPVPTFDPQQQKFNDFLNSGVLDELTVAFAKQYHSMMEKTFVECLEKFLGRIPTDLEVLQNCHSVVNQETRHVSFFYRNYPLYTISWQLTPDNKIEATIYKHV